MSVGGGRVCCARVTVHTPSRLCARRIGVASLSSGEAHEAQSSGSRVVVVSSACAHRRDPSSFLFMGTVQCSMQGRQGRGSVNVKQCSRNH
jgi:hypothetical protein